MPRDIPIGNGSLLILYDKSGLVRDLCFPSVGSENHSQGHAFKVGVWVNGTFSWIDEDAWDRSLDYEDDTLVARIDLVNKALDLHIMMRDIVDFHENIYVREIAVRNVSFQPMELRLTSIMISTSTVRISAIQSVSSRKGRGFYITREGDIFSLTL